MPAPPKDAAGAFEGGLFGAGYFFPLLKVVETVSGVFLLVNKYTALFLLIIFPITLNIFLFHAFLEPSGLTMAGPMILINIFLGYAYPQNIIHQYLPCRQHCKASIKL